MNYNAFTSAKIDLLDTIKRYPRATSSHFIGPDINEFDTIMVFISDLSQNVTICESKIMALSDREKELLEVDLQRLANDHPFVLFTINEINISSVLSTPIQPTVNH